jgi:hypothetical protein
MFTQGVQVPQFRLFYEGFQSVREQYILNSYNAIMT